jgi:hypothetical protein
VQRALASVKRPGDVWEGTGGSGGGDGRCRTSYVLRGLCAIAGVSRGSLVRLYCTVSVSQAHNAHLQCSRVEASAQAAPTHARPVSGDD